MPRRAEALEKSTTPCAAPSLERETEREGRGVCVCNS